jgi:hypothetical protein
VTKVYVIKVYVAYEGNEIVDIFSSKRKTNKECSILTINCTNSYEKFVVEEYEVK